MDHLLTSVARPWRVPLPAGPPAWRAAELVAGDADAVVLTGDWAGVAAIAVSEPPVTVPAGVDPLQAIDEHPSIGAGDDVVVGGGWFGYLGYQIGRAVEALGGPPPAVDELPRAVMAYHDHAVVLDASGRWWFEALWTAGRAEILRDRLQVLRDRASAAASGAPPAPPAAAGPWRSTPSPGAHRRAVDACRERIAAGDLFQANLAVRLRAPLPGDPAALFAAGVRELAPARAALIRGAWGAVVSLSPELFLARRGRDVRSAPIKGTRPRPADDHEAARLRDELAASEKDRAENVMIVDLVRNDLGRVCRYGSVHAPVIARPEAHTGVWHLVSQVTGVLREDVGDADLVRAAFPPGSITGAPKIAAMNVISELESTARQAYTGAAGLVSPVAGLELNVAIRTFEIRDGMAALQVGGGIVADSDADGEAAEALTKAAPLLRAIGSPAETADTVPRGTPGAPRRRGPQPDPRPVPRAGLLETILVRDGMPVALDAHLERLAASARSLYAVPLPAGIEHTVRACAAQAPPGAARVRVVLEPPGDGLEMALADARAAGAGSAARVTATLGPPAPLRPVALASAVVPGGLGPYKWADRRLLDALSADSAPAIPLLVDADGLVLEAAMANVLLLSPGGGALATPPADGRILPGTARARALRAARELGIDVQERPLVLEELRAGTVAVTSALRGVVAVERLDGERCGEPSSALAALAARLAAGHDRSGLLVG